MPNKLPVFMEISPAARSCMLNRLLTCKQKTSIKSQIMHAEQVLKTISHINITCTQVMHTEQVLKKSHLK